MFYWAQIVNVSEFRFYIHVSKSQIKLSVNPLINESHLSLINIANNALGKQIWFWIWVQGKSFHLMTVGNVIINLGNNFRFVRLNVDDSPFQKIRGLITSNVYDNNSEAYVKAREFESARYNNIKLIMIR